MSRVTPVSPEKATGEVKEIFNGMGNVFNIFRCMANSPATLKAFTEFSKASSHTSLDPKLREAIALAVAETNACQYCLSAHSFIASKKLNFSEAQIVDARKGKFADAKSTAILNFAKNVVEKRGKVTDEDVNELKKQGVNDQELVEIVFIIMVNMFTNYFNHIVDTKIDFPTPVAIK